MRPDSLKNIPCLGVLTQIGFMIIPLSSPAKFFNKSQNCKLLTVDDDNQMGYSRDGDIIIGGILKILLLYGGLKPDFLETPYDGSCAAPTFHYLRHLLAFIYAIEEINNSTDILPNVTLGFQIYDACSEETMALKNTMKLLSETPEFLPNCICHKRHRMAAVIGHLSSSETYSMAHITQLFGYPQISYGALDPIFNDRVSFPSLYRTVPTEHSQFKVIIQILTYFGWTWVGILSSEDDSNHKASEMLKNEMEKKGICVDFIVSISAIEYNVKPNTMRSLERIKNSSVNVIILYCSGVVFISLLQNEKFKTISGKVWISSLSMNIIAEYKLQIHEFNGSLLITVSKGEIPGFKTFLSSATWYNMPDNQFVHDFWSLNLGCNDDTFSLNMPDLDCSGQSLWKEHLANQEAIIYRITYSIYNAVYFVAQALHGMYVDNVLFENHSKNLAIDARYKLNRYLKKIHLKTTTDEIFFNEKGCVAGKFDVINWVIYPNGTIMKVQVGRFSLSDPQKLIINDSAIAWNPHFSKTPRSLCTEICPPGHWKSHQTGKLSCCFDCIACADGEVANSSDMEKCVKCPENYWSNFRRDQCIKQTIDFLSYEDYLGAMLAALAFFCFLITSAVFCIFVKYRNTPIVKANNRILSYILLVALMLSFLSSFLFIGRPMEFTCILRQAVFGFIFTVAISSVLGKTLTVVIAFNATKPGSKLKKWVGFKMSSGLLCICSAGELVICTTWLACCPPFVDCDKKSTPGIIILQCNEGSIIAFYLSISYFGALALISFVFAFIVRKLPDTFNEAKYITFSMLVTCSVWVSFIPTYLSTKGKYTVAVEIFTILCSTTGLLSCIFFPKCYIILMKSECNSRKHLVLNKMNEGRNVGTFRG